MAINNAVALGISPPAAPTNPLEQATKLAALSKAVGAIRASQGERTLGDKIDDLNANVTATRNRMDAHRGRSPAYGSDDGSAFGGYRYTKAAFGDNPGPTYSPAPANQTFTGPTRTSRVVSVDGQPVDDVDQ